MSSTKVKCIKMNFDSTPLVLTGRFCKNLGCNIFMGSCYYGVLDLCHRLTEINNKYIRLIFIMISQYEEVPTKQVMTGIKPDQNRSSSTDTGRNISKLTVHSYILLIHLCVRKEEMAKTASVIRSKSWIFRQPCQLGADLEPQPNLWRLTTQVSVKTPPLPYSPHLT